MSGRGHPRFDRPSQGRGGRHRKVGRERERAAATAFAMHVNAAAHQVAQPRCDRKTQPRAAVTAGARVVALLEGFKDFPLHIRRNTDARVDDFKAKNRLDRLGRRLSGQNRRRKRVFQRDAQDRSAAFGELDGIADKIDQHLTKPPGGAYQRIGYVVAYLADQLDAFAVRSHGQRADDLVHVQA